MSTSVQKAPNVGRSCVFRLATEPPGTQVYGSLRSGFISNWPM